MRKIDVEKAFMNERIMLTVSILSMVFGMVSVVILSVNHALTILDLFAKLVKLIMTALTLWTFLRVHWDAMKGMLGGLLFSLLFQESFLVLGNLWGGTTEFDVYLIMGVQGSLFLSAQTLSFMMTIIIIINHFVIDYSNAGNYANVIFNQISILFKIVLYVSLLIINGTLDLPVYQQINAGFEYITDLAIIIMIICIESQLDSFKSIRSELLKAKRKGKQA